MSPDEEGPVVVAALVAIFFYTAFVLGLVKIFQCAWIVSTIDEDYPVDIDPLTGRLILETEAAPLDTDEIIVPNREPVILPNSYVGQLDNGPQDV